MDAAPRVFVIKNRKRTDVTEEVKTVLDLLSSSLDWGSGFLCADDLEAWARIAEALDIAEAAGVFRLAKQTRVDDERYEMEQRAREKAEKEHRKAVDKALLGDATKYRWIHQARSLDGEVLYEVRADAGVRVGWYPSGGIRQPIEWWVNEGRGFKKVAETA